MKVYINDNQIEYDFIEVKINKYILTREFEIQVTSKKQDIGFDAVKIFLEDNLLLEGKIENQEIKNNYYVYSGRSNQRDFLDSFTKKNYQFKENVSLDTILNTLKGNFDIKINGAGNKISKSKIEIGIGINHSILLRELSLIYRNYLTGGPNNELYIDNPILDSDAYQFEYGKNINIRTNDIRKDFEYDKYTIVSIYKKGSHGDGPREYIEYVDLNLSEIECKNIAKFRLELNNKKKMNYCSKIIPMIYLNINNKLYIIDEDLNLKKGLIVKGLIYTQSDLESSLEVNFEEEI